MQAPVGELGKELHLKGLPALKKQKEEVFLGFGKVTWEEPVQNVSDWKSLEGMRKRIKEGTKSPYAVNVAQYEAWESKLVDGSERDSGVVTKADETLAFWFAVVFVIVMVNVLVHSDGVCDCDCAGDCVGVL